MHQVLGSRVDPMVPYLESSEAHDNTIRQAKETYNKGRGPYEGPIGNPLHQASPSA